ncbi:MAG: dTDP-4-dehydrorhamnose reductase [Muribaculaceae bacterium]|nr:dTDP-4-dehydrorhamnose reductase [Muribaculaceae bacterium]
MKILVTGANGQLGRELRNVLEARMPGSAVYVDRDELDITDRAATEAFLRGSDFTHIINCAAYTAVDKAEEEYNACAAVNIDGVTNLARVADELGIRIIHVSTDYVFDGHAYRPYTESDKVNPTSQYGATKRKGETSLLGLAPDSVIVRTSWLYSPYGHNFVKTILDKASTSKRLNVVYDQIGSPTNARDLAEAIYTILTARQWKPGIINFSNEGVCSWYDFATAIVRLAGIKGCEIMPIPTADYPTPAKRPYYSVLDKNRFRVTYSYKIPHWEESLARCISRIQSGEK